MSELFGVISDSHNHNWNTFSKTLPTGVNDRLQWILDETKRAAENVKMAGGDTLVHCGDVFHVRGSVAPSVLNPTVETYKYITKELGMNVLLIAGNHDLEGKNSTKLGNAGEALAGVGVDVISQPHVLHRLKFVLLPYYDSCDKLREVIKEQQTHIPDDEICEYTLFIHAPMNGVIAGIPDHGFSAKELESFGFKRVFCGHYHNHKAFGEVYSVGALTHQTFGDVGSKAGYLLVSDKVTHYPTNAPRFVDFDPEWDELEEVENITGNYVRAKLESATNDEVEQVRKYLIERGAAAVTITHVPKSVTVREGEEAPSVEAGASMRVSLADWCKKREYSAQVIADAQSILDDVESKV